MESLFDALRAGARFQRPNASGRGRPSPSGTLELDKTIATKAAEPHAASLRALDFFARAPASQTHHIRQHHPQEGSDRERKKRKLPIAQGKMGGGSHEEEIEHMGGTVAGQIKTITRQEDGTRGDDVSSRSIKGNMERKQKKHKRGADQGVNVFRKKKAGEQLSSAVNESEEDQTDDDDASRSGAVKGEEEEEMRAFRRRMQIHVSGDDVPACIASFTEMTGENNVKATLLRNIESSKWTEPTPIQMQSMTALATGRDVLASAPTGSGKTAAFVLPTILRLSQTPRKSGDSSKPHVLFLAPTRELAAQIHREVERLLAGSKRFRSCLLSKALAATAKASGGKATLGVYDVMVATPMRLVSVLREEVLDLSHVQVVVLDEADKLFELGRDRGEEAGAADRSFLAQVDEILAACSHPQVQRALFSATLPPQVEDLASTVLREPIKISIGTKMAGASTIDQRLVFVGREEGKLLGMRQLVREGLRPPVLVFLQSKERARELFHELVYDGIKVDVMHAERTPEQRDALIKRFRSGDIWVLLTTDLMARGLDFKAVNMVINYDLPQSAVSYIHRIGRTGRAGRSGLAVTFFTEADMPYMRSIANVIKLSGCPVPEYLLAMKKEGSRDKRHREVSAPKRRRISTVTGFDKARAFKKKQAVVHSKQGSRGGQVDDDADADDDEGDVQKEE